MNPESGHRDISREQAAILVLTLLLLDAVVMLGNVSHLLFLGVDFTSDRAWNGDLDGSYIEMLGHAKLVLASVMLSVLWRSRRSAIYAAWALIFATVAADDFLLVHERGGRWLESTFDVPSVLGLRPEDLGELAVWAVLGTALLVVLVLADRRSPRQDHAVTRAFLALLAVLAVFAVALDMVAIVLEPYFSDRAYRIITFVETAGELGSMTLIAATAHRLTLGLPAFPRLRGRGSRTARRHATTSSH